MPVQINEIAIRVTVSSGAGAEQKEGQSGSLKPPGGEASAGASTADDIVEKVLEILKSKKER